MKINGHRTHLGERPRSGGVRPDLPPIAPRPSVEVDLEVVWYPHKCAPSLLPADLVEPHANHLQSRGAIALRSPTVVTWSWLG